MPRKLALCLSLIAVLIAGDGARLWANDGNAVADATASAEHWLKLVDENKYSESWTQASALFQERVSREAWATQVSAVRNPLGPLLSRKLVSAHYTTSLPAAPDGHYAVIRYESSFAHKKSAVETVTMMLEPNGAWRSGGYFIR